ncbi:hypothetical protein GCM10023354_12100 [Garicola koreensis]|uniref:LysR family transcriptional regulator n=1 Tax=Garicola koreensis TaxID=1262554 RepID=UPI0031E9B2A4
METRLLRYFVAVVDAGTVSAAADELHMTQPGLSRQIRQLEQQLGLTLFSRAGGRLQLSSQGREFYGTAADLLQRHRAAGEYAAHLAQGRMPTISLGAPTTTLTDVVAPFVATFHPQDPVPSVTEMLLEADMDRALSTVDLLVAPVRPPAEVASLHLVNLPVWAYVPQPHQWAARASVTLEELTQETLILPSMEFKARRVLESALDDAQLNPPTTLQTPHSQVAQALAAAGRGAAVVTDDARYDLHPLRILHRDAPLQIHLYAAWRAEHHAVFTLERLADRLREFCQARYPSLG